MKKIGFALAAMMALAGCTTSEQDAAVGAGLGAVVGGIASGDAGGAAIGAVAGGISGVLLGTATRTGWGRYRDRNGRIYEARCR